MPRHMTCASCENFLTDTECVECGTPVCDQCANEEPIRVCPSCRSALAAQHDADQYHALQRLEREDRCHDGDDPEELWLEAAFAADDRDASY